MSVDDITPEILHEYFAEAIHNGWEGWTRSQIKTIGLLIDDIRLYSETCKSIKDLT